MNSSRIEIALWVATATFGVGAGIAGRMTSASPVDAARGAPIVADPRAPDADSLAASARALADGDPFRLDHRPTAVAYRPELEGVTPPPRPPKPVLVVEGVVGRSALLDGVPGRPVTALVHAGDTLGGLRVRRITPDTVIVSDADTTWRLIVRRLWQ